MSMARACLYNIPAGISFVDMLAKGLLDKASKDDPLSLARMHVLLPTRRAARSLREAFLRFNNGAPMLLPRMDPIGDVDEEELSLSLMGISAEDELSLPPAIGQMQRKFLLARLVNAQGHGKGIAQDMALADALGRLMDQIYTEDLDLADLPGIVDNSGFAKHWQISLDFLSLLSQHWPAILAENNVIDAADRRNRLLRQLGKYWSANPPPYPVIAAGTTGSIPATAALLKSIVAMPDGCVVLPGLDQNMDDESWAAMDDTHPQATLRNLLMTLEKKRDDVKLWPACPEIDTQLQKMQRFSSEIMRPAATTEEWQNLKNDFPIKETDFSIERYDCATPQEEALTIALAMRDTLENKEKTAALVTPDRKLARRVAMACRRWGIEIDDSGGEKLSETHLGLFFLLAIKSISDDMRPVSLLDFLKHDLCDPVGQEDWNKKINGLDAHIMRGPAFEGGIRHYHKKIATLQLAEMERGSQRTNFADFKHTLDFIECAFSPLLSLSAQNDGVPFESWCRAHMQAAEKFCPPEILWSGQEGEAASIFFAEILEAAPLLPALSVNDYLAILQQVMSAVTVRPRYGRHPRLMILGQLEARLGRADVMILSGLNEGTWPPAPSPDPWMSRPMRKRFGLPPQERSIGLSAHDFAQNIGANKLILTRSMRVDGTPTVPSRWLQKMDTVLEACGLDSAFIRQGKYSQFAQEIDAAGEYRPVERPAPKPPVDARPRAISVTKIDTWMKDPYSIYARYVLDLKPLEPLEQSLDAAMRGTMIHKVLDRFISKYPNDIPESAQKDFMLIARQELEQLGIDAAIRAFWEPRLLKISGWFVNAERMWRIEMKPTSREKSGKIFFPGPAGEFTLKGIADRIDVSHSGEYGAIIDYKSGGSFTPKGIKNGQYTQLPLEALMLENGGFEDTEKLEVQKLSYWILNGSKEGGSIVTLESSGDIREAKDNARDGLLSLIARFDSTDMPYFSVPRPEHAPAYNDYEHLARVREWATLDDTEAA